MLHGVVEEETLVATSSMVPLVPGTWYRCSPSIWTGADGCTPVPTGSRSSAFLLATSCVLLKMELIRTP